MISCACQAFRVVGRRLVSQGLTAIPSGMRSTRHRTDTPSHVLRSPFAIRVIGDKASSPLPFRAPSTPTFATLGGDKCREAAYADMGTDGLARLLRATFLMPLNAPMLASSRVPITAFGAAVNSSCSCLLSITNTFCSRAM